LLRKKDLAEFWEERQSVFEKNEGDLWKNNKGSRDISLARAFEGSCGGQNRPGEKERWKTCTRRNARVPTRTWNNHCQITPKLGPKKPHPPKKT
jgi:hypothetical protein